ncbi:hypothetical protein KAFR_0J01610 [Kazachstania africana CBS 2517]|uniref:Myb-like domain-containing protein n=1 Tax=Kazachstania africana (strain ATCC 22294 / BCRC 22015 / CBS 2517 / CECT 1963 / NBRC 1671 / NRRL Y-8276) TaxID=1071382 RepID=H2B0S6_KAZAF|nr:hypothetical protein KAFR_0J01610 [Kazachstania africana CBS 2517]CCF60226.1 hypothetical protein KAFR_0J01610 [Kazachstania africana CBS 2517]
MNLYESKFSAGEDEESIDSNHIISEINFNDSIQKDGNKIVNGNNPSMMNAYFHPDTNSINSIEENNTFTNSNSETSTVYGMSPMTAPSSSNNKQTRKKWKEAEDIAFLTVILNHSLLLTYVEYFKPMKNFWLKISKILHEEHRYERNARQCHDRFKVLFSKATKLKESSIKGVKFADLQYLLLKLVNTFRFHNGNIVLRSHSKLSSKSVNSPDQSNHHNAQDNINLKSESPYNLNNHTDNTTDFALQNPSENGYGNNNNTGNRSNSNLSEFVHYSRSMQQTTPSGGELTNLPNVCTSTETVDYSQNPFKRIREPIQRRNEAAQSLNGLPENEIQYMHNMYQSLYNMVGNFKNQVDSLQAQVNSLTSELYSVRRVLNSLDDNTQSHRNILQNLYTMVQSSDENNKNNNNGLDSDDHKEKRIEK